VTTRRLFIAGLLLGLGLRLAALPLPGTFDVTAFKVWSHAAATGAVPEMYGVGGTPPERRLHEYDHWRATVNYPPAALYELAAAGRLYKKIFPGYPNTPALTAAIKLLPVAFEAGIAGLLFWAVGRTRPGQPRLARFAALAYWLNPAVLLTSSVLGYVDALFALPALGALVAAAAGLAGLSGLLLALAVLTKPQAVFVVPAMALALLGRSSTRSLLPGLKACGLAAAGAAAASAVVLTPVVAAGAWPNFLQAMRSFGRHDMLSGQAANLWWIVTYVMRAIYAVPDMGLAGAFFSPVRRPLAITTVVQLGYPDPRTAAALLVLAAVAWSLWTGRKVRDLPRLALIGAWTSYAYFMLSVQVHENHFVLVLPPLALAAAALPEWRRPFWILSGIFALNLNLFYGFGDGIGFAVPRLATGIDATAVLSAANVAVFAWCAVLLRRSLRGASATLPTTDPAGSPRPRESSLP
jgi:hypothetical protein